MNILFSCPEENKIKPVQEKGSYDVITDVHLGIILYIVL